MVRRHELMVAQGTPSGGGGGVAKRSKDGGLGWKRGALGRCNRRGSHHGVNEDSGGGSDWLWGKVIARRTADEESPNWWRMDEEGAWEHALTWMVGRRAHRGGGGGHAAKLYLERRRWTGGIEKGLEERNREAKAML